MPNDQIYKFEGSLNLSGGRKRVSLGSENLLLRGSSLRNTEWVLGFVVYAGHQTKIMMNSANSRFKMSSIERGTNRQIILIFIVQIIMCLLSAITGIIWQKTLPSDADSYLELGQGKAANWNTSPFLMLIKQTGTWLLIFT